MELRLFDIELSWIDAHGVEKSNAQLNRCWMLELIDVKHNQKLANYQVRLLLNDVMRP